MLTLASTISRQLPAAVLAALLGAGAAFAPALAQVTAKESAGPPDFTTGNAGWVTIGTDWIALPGSPPPVTSDPAHPYVPNNTGKQPTFRVADLNNPNLTQFAKDALKKSNDEVLGGKAMYARESRCWATGVPAYLLNPGGPTYWLQTPEKVAMIWQLDHQVRHVYLNVPHTANPKPSWYGESVGHYEGDTLVVDTIGQNTKSFVDNYRTPHSEKLHVLERYHLVDGGKMLQAEVTIEDPAIFIQPLQVVHRWRRMQGTIIESTCAEGEISNPFKQDVEPIPTAEKSDF
ncbi:MAG TPA: hypothetical protein VGL31_08335 [Xanthobacteraceae bacterium]|jgi:hypothetical protein